MLVISHGKSQLQVYSGSEWVLASCHLIFPVLLLSENYKTSLMKTKEETGMVEERWFTYRLYIHLYIFNLEDLICLT